jgi:hypothetical protein
MSNVLDLGHGHTLRYFSWAPERDINPQYDGIPDEPQAGAILDHLKPDGSTCSGAVTFDTPTMQRVSPNANRWTVESWDPLTLSPSVLCRTCGDHGHVREGRWEPC